MLHGTYTEAAILDVKKTVESYALQYRNLYIQRSMALEKLVDKSIEQNVLQCIGSIPLVKEGPVDERLQEGGAKLEKSNRKHPCRIRRNEQPWHSLFTDKMDDLIQIYNHTEVICFDKEGLWLVGE